MSERVLHQPLGASRPTTSTELEGGGLPQGFRAAGVAAGIKPSGAPDLGLMVCDAADTTSAARFTSSGALGAPVLLCREVRRWRAARGGRQLRQRQRRHRPARARERGQDAGRGARCRRCRRETRWRSPPPA